MWQRIGMLLLSAALLLAACDRIGVQGGAAQLLPDLPNANVIEGQTITQYITNLGEGASLLQANPLLAGAIAIADNAVTCYQDLGAVAMRLYSDKTTPLSSGAAAIVDKKALLDPGNLILCVTGQAQNNFAGQTLTIQPCFHTYVLTKDDREYHIVYLGTTAEICDALCNGLEGCVASRRGG